MTTNRKTAKKAAPRSNGQRRTTPTKPTVQQQLDLLAWLHEELVYSVRVALAQLALQSPAVQQQLAAQIAQQGGMQ